MVLHEIKSKKKFSTNKTCVFNEYRIKEAKNILQATFILDFLCFSVFDFETLIAFVQAGLGCILFFCRNVIFLCKIPLSPVLLLGRQREKRDKTRCAGY